MEDPQISRATAAYTARLDYTVKGLQGRLKEQESALEKLRATTTPFDLTPSTDPKIRLQQLHLLTQTYKAVLSEPPYLPPADSPLPALLAIQETQKTITETHICHGRTERELKELQSRLEKEKADLQDARLIQASLQSRISSLEAQIEEQTQRSPALIAETLITELVRKQTHYDTETGKLVRAFNAFIDDQLAVMLAAEELGGPIAGDVPDISEEMLEAGFSTRGKVRRASTSKNEDKRQRRIDEIWGPRPSGSEVGGEEAEEKPWDEKTAAAAEMRELSEQLLNALVESEEGTGDGPYVVLKRESAAARFLVRSKVAVFHPRDAGRLRLVDFGREIED